MVQRHIVIASHSTLSAGMKETLAFFLSAEARNIFVITAYVNNLPIEQEIEDVFNKFSSDDEVIVFTDILSGSVNQKLYKYIKRKHTHIIAGMNLPLIMGIMMEPSDKYLTAEKINNIIAEARSQIQYVNEISKTYSGAVDVGDE